MRGRLAAQAARTASQVKAERAQAKERSRQLEADRQKALDNYEELKQQAAHWREALTAARQGQAQRAEQAEQASTLQARLLALQDQAQASQQALQRSEASHAENAESLKQAHARLAALEAENTALRHDAASLSTALSAALPAAQTAAPQASVTRLPFLEEEVIALQSLATTIQQEFQLLAELQRTFTLTSTTVQEFS